jgi:hypothetical protein
MMVNRNRSCAMNKVKRQTSQRRTKDAKVKMIPVVMSECLECIEDAFVVRRKGKMMVIHVNDTTAAELKERMDYWRDFIMSFYDMDARLDARAAVVQ